MRLSFKNSIFVAALFSASVTAADAGIISTLPQWNGSTSVASWGGGGTGVYGETFSAPTNQLDSFTFEVNDFGVAANFVAQVYAWSGSLLAGNSPQGATGPALYTSSTLHTSGVVGFNAITINTGGVSLTPGNNYVMLFADIGGDTTAGEFGLVGSPTSVPGDGGFNFYNNNYTLSSINSNPWDDFGNFGSLAYTAKFGSASSVPEPPTLALMGLGLAGLGVSRRKAKKPI